MFAIVTSFIVNPVINSLNVRFGIIVQLSYNSVEKSPENLFIALVEVLARYIMPTVLNYFLIVLRNLFV